MSPEEQLDGFIGKYSPAVAAQARGALERLRARFPGAVELVYDNYNALAIGWGPSERASDVILSIALFPRWVSLFFMHGADLPDPHQLLKGSGRQVRHIVLASSHTLEQPAVQELIAEAVARAPVPLDGAQPRRLVVKSISARQRPRRPGQQQAAPRPRAHGQGHRHGR